MVNEAMVNNFEVEVSMIAPRKDRGLGANKRTTVSAVFLRLKARTVEAALADAKALCKPCNMRSYAGVKWTDVDKIEHRWTWNDIQKLDADS